ncbi:hypothetical protein [Parachitinimonas caeni]|uniref:Uncharacterized protein n=1 Tax=Parachitinimonas caeni TaxID=3031301 RepID=A0ABT7DWE0_9NEIS|nr:hypothetical protein [Parachitinimonas caeni]MDK2123475.1 hypothetical protein [Parachitinimonas caeni]
MRIDAEAGIRAHHKWRYKATTNSKHSMLVVPNVFKREFNTTAPGTARPRFLSLQLIDATTSLTSGGSHSSIGYQTLVQRCAESMTTLKMAA